MDKLLFIVMTGILVFVFFKNISLFKRYKQNKSYIDCYQAVLYGKEDGYNLITEYIEKEKSEEYKNKARIIKLISELENGLDYSKTTEDLDIKSLFYKKGSPDKTLLRLNSDSFVFIMMVIIKAYKKNKFELIEKIIDKVNVLPELEGRLEYQEIKALANVLTNKEYKDFSLFYSLLEGTYTQYSYDKNMIGLYKRIASSTLEKNKETFDEYFKNDLYSFAKSMIGKNILIDYDLYETYKPVEETEKVEETTTEEGNK